jgi:hypothetical protein
VVEGKTEEAGPTESRAPDFDLLAVLEEPRRSLPAALRRDWLGEWSHARAYTYNFVRYGPRSGRIRVFDGEWNSALRQVITLSKEQAEAALELTHRTAGEILASKCAFPRHAVVFFDAADRPLASVNVCFSCSDVLVWPRYGTQEAQDSKHSNLERFTSVHDEVMERWQLFFDGLGADRYSGGGQQEYPGRP